MQSLLISFFSAFICTLLIIRYKHLHQEFSSDWDLKGPQKFHILVVPRIGGVSLAFGAFAGITLGQPHPQEHLDLILVICSIPIFAIGLLEDITKKVGIKSRLIFAMISGTLVITLMGAKITRFGIPHIDAIIAFPIIGFGITIFAVVGLINAYNIIDGFNGLSSMVGIIALLSIAYVSYLLADPILTRLSLVLVASIIGFFIWNYPRGLIFLGDGGAYLIGFWVASLSILVTYRHQQISPWFAFLINCYPITETLFSIYRRKIHSGKNPGHPDGMHFHTLIYRRILYHNAKVDNHYSANSKTAPYLWALTLTTVTPAIIFWNSTEILALSSGIFSIIYIWLYTRIVNFKTPKWMHIG